MDKLIANVAGAYGGAVADSDFQVLMPMLSGESSTQIGFGMCVSIQGALGARKTILKATTGVAATAVIGIANETINAGEIGLIVIHGLIHGVAAQGAINALDQVTRSGTTAGSVAAVAAQDATLVVGTVIGLAVAAAAGNLTDVFVRQC